MIIAYEVCFIRNNLLNPVARYGILKLQKEQPPQYKGLA